MLRTTILTASALVLMGAVTPAAAAFNVTAPNSVSFSIDGQPDPELTLTRGQTYEFNVNTPGHPFWIKTVQSTGTSNAYNDGVTNNGTQSGTLTFMVPMSAPSTLFYNCQIHASMTNVIHIVSPAPGMSPWGVAAASVLVGATAVFALRRRSAWA